MRASGRVGVLEMLELAIKLVVGTARVQAGTRLRKLKILAAARMLLEVGRKKAVQLVMQPGAVGETVGRHLMALVGASGLA